MYRDSRVTFFFKSCGHGRSTLSVRYGESYLASLFVRNKLNLLAMQFIIRVRDLVARIGSEIGPPLSNDALSIKRLRDRLRKSRKPQISQKTRPPKWQQKQRLTTDVCCRFWQQKAITGLSTTLDNKFENNTVRTYEAYKRRGTDSTKRTMRYVRMCVCVYVRT